MRRQLIIWRRNFKEVAPNNRNMVLMNGEDNDCQPKLALSAKSCASLQLLLKQPSGFSALAPVAGRLLVADCSLRAVVRAPGDSLPLFSFRAL